MEIRFLRQAHKFIKQANKQLKEKIKLEVLKIRDTPKIGNLLKNKLKKIRSHHFIHYKVQYRIAYIVENNVLIIIITIGSRENFYRDIK